MAHVTSRKTEMMSPTTLNHCATLNAMLKASQASDHCQSPSYSLYLQSGYIQSVNGHGRQQVRFGDISVTGAHSRPPMPDSI